MLFLLLLHFGRPIAAQTIGRVACQLGEKRPDLLVRDDLEAVTGTDNADTQ